MKLKPLALALLTVTATSALAAPTAIGKAEGKLNIIAWPGYIERGETDKNYDWGQPV